LLRKKETLNILLSLVAVVVASELVAVVVLVDCYLARDLLSRHKAIQLQWEREALALLLAQAADLERLEVIRCFPP
jgi:hypothetical protein